MCAVCPAQDTFINLIQAGPTVLGNPLLAATTPIGWHTESFGDGLLLQVRFAETPEDLAEGMLGVVQLGVSAEQALLIAKELTNLANQILATQTTQINKSLQ